MRIEITEKYRRAAGDTAAVGAVVAKLREEITGQLARFPVGAGFELRFVLSTVPSEARAGDLQLAAHALRHAHDGLSVPGLLFVLQQAAAAYLDRPEAPMLEIGSYKGCTALALLELLDGLSGGAPPLLVTVDPYGGKPYRGGDAVVEGAYGDPIYVAQKTNTSGYANHAHFLMTGIEFLERCVGTPYWLRGDQRWLEGFSFAFVDGEHDLDTVRAELVNLFERMDPTGRIVVDNVDKDPDLIPFLLGQGAELGPEAEPGARQAVIRMRGR